MYLFMDHSFLSYPILFRMKSEEKYTHYPQYGINCNNIMVVKQIWYQKIIHFNLILISTYVHITCASLKEVYYVKKYFTWKFVEKGIIINCKDITMAKIAYNIFLKINDQKNWRSVYIQPYKLGVFIMASW